MASSKNDLEDALVAWWYARTLLDAAVSRMSCGIETIEHARAHRIECQARDALYETTESYLGSTPVAPAFDPLCRPAGHFAEPTLPPPRSPAHRK